MASQYSDPFKAEAQTANVAPTSNAISRTYDTNEKITADTKAGQQAAPGGFPQAMRNVMAYTGMDQRTTVVGPKSIVTSIPDEYEEKLAYLSMLKEMGVADVMDPEALTEGLLDTELRIQREKKTNSYISYILSIFYKSATRTDREDLKRKHKEIFDMYKKRILANIDLHEKYALMLTGNTNMKEKLMMTYQIDRSNVKISNTLIKDLVGLNQAEISNVDVSKDGNTYRGITRKGNFTPADESLYFIAQKPE